MERMKKEKESGTLLGVGTTYLQAKEIKGEFYVKVSDFNKCMESMRKELEIATKCSSQEEGKLRKLEKENKKLSEENGQLKSDLANIQCEFGFECDECEYWKREMKKHKPNLIKEEYVFNLGDYDYMVLTSTTPQLKIIKKNNKGISTFTVK